MALFPRKMIFFDFSNKKRLKYFVGIKIVLNFASAFDSEMSVSLSSLRKLHINEQKQQVTSPSCCIK